MSADYLIVGHVTQDVTPEGVRLGGTAYYATVTAQRLGYEVFLVTRAPLEIDLATYLPGVHLHVLEAEKATTFENHYRGAGREQVIHFVAPPLGWDDIPPAWHRARIVHLAPVAQEVDRSLLNRFPASLLAVTPQGWMRAWDEEGRVRYASLDSPRRLLEPVDVLVFSMEDVNHDPHAMRRLIEAVPVTVVTRASEGATVYTPDGARPLPARPADVKDLTGAGDVFAAAYFLRLYEQGDPLEAGAFANVVASFSVEGVGTTRIPVRAEVEQWLAAQRGNMLGRISRTE